MKTWIIVRKDDFSIQGSYLAEEKDDSSANRSWLQAEPVCKHLELPEGLEKDLVEAFMDGEELALRHSDSKEDVQIASAWSVLRYKRDGLLAETDKYMLTDYPISQGNKTAVEAYRNALRDLPSQVTDPRDEVTWPSMPQV